MTLTKMQRSQAPKASYNNVLSISIVFKTRI